MFCLIRIKNNVKDVVDEVDIDEDEVVKINSIKKKKKERESKVNLLYLAGIAHEFLDV